MSCGIAFAQQPVGLGQSLPQFRTVAAIKSLSSLELKRGFPVLLNGVITYLDSSAPDIFIQDSTGGIWVEWSSDCANIRAGQRVELRGVTGSGIQATVARASCRVLGEGALPKPRQVSLGALLSDRADAEWVETVAVIRAVEPILGGLLQLRLEVDGGRVLADVVSHGPIPESLVDARVRIRGVAGAIVNRRIQTIGAILYIPGLEYIHVLEPARTTAFDAPLQPVDVALRAGSRGDTIRRVRIRGTVTAVWQRKGFFLGDPSGTVFVDVRNAGSVRVGDIVEASGFPGILDHRPAIEDAVCRRMGRGAAIPTPISAADALNGAKDAALVSILGSLQAFSRLPDESTFVFQEKTGLFSASLQGRLTEADLEALRPGSLVRVTGICLVQIDELGGPVSFKIHLRSIRDLQVVRRAPWLNASRALSLLTLLVLAIAGALAWVGYLRYRVRRQTEMIRATLESTGDGILVIDSKGRILLWNEKFAAMWHIPVKTLRAGDEQTALQHRVNDLADPAGFLAKVHQLNGSTEHTDDLVEFKDGTVFERHSEPQWIEGKIVGRVWGFRDVTDRRRAEESLHLHTAQQAAVAELGRFALSQTNLEAVYDLAVRLVTETVGVERCWICPQGDTCRESEPDGPCTLRIPIGSETNRYGELVVLPNDGRQFTDADRHFLQSLAHVLATAIERNEGEAKLERAKEAALAASRAKGEFLANMSHEVRTPLNGILGLAAVLLDNGPTTDQRNCLEIMKGSAESLLGVINDILDFSKIEAGKMDLDYLPCQPRQLVEQVVQVFALPAAQKRVELGYEVKDGVPEWILCDPARLRQVFTNLVANALKFTEDGSVTLELGPEGDGLPEVLHCVVRDTGIGIPEENQRVIFEAFSQADSSTTRKYGGTGLGLTISSRLVGAMGGRVWVSSEVGKGSEFHFTIPAPAVSGAPLEPKAAPEPIADSPRRRILLAEDNSVNQLVTMRLLTKRGHSVTVANNGREALALLQRENFDLILMDVQMPEMDGLEATKEIRLQEQQTGGHIRIVAMTALAMKGDAERCTAAGMDAYLSKPIRPRELYKLVEAPQEQDVPTPSPA